MQILFTFLITGRRMLLGICAKQCTQCRQHFRRQRSEIRFSVQRTEFIDMIPLPAELFPGEGFHFSGVVNIVTPLALVIVHQAGQFWVTAYFSQRAFICTVEFQRQIFPTDIGKQRVQCRFRVPAERVGKRRFPANILHGNQTSVDLAESQVHALIPHQKASDGNVVHIAFRLRDQRGIFSQGFR